MSGNGTKPRSDSSPGGSGAADKADVQARTHPVIIVRMRINQAVARSLVMTSHREDQSYELDDRAIRRRLPVRRGAVCRDGATERCLLVPLSKLPEAQRCARFRLRRIR